MKLVYALALIAAIAIIVPLTILQLQPRPVDVQTLHYDFEVVDGVALNLDVDKLHFGGGIPGTTLERGVNMTLSEPGRIVFVFDGEGNVVVSENDFYLDANVEKEINFSLTIPNLPIGLYNGTIYVERYAR